MEGGQATALSLRQIKVDVGLSPNSSNDSVDSDALGTRCSKYIKTIDAVNHVLIVSLTVFTLFHSMQVYNVMNLHVSLCTLGYVLLMSEAIVVLAGESVLTNSLTHRAKKHVHWFLQILGLISIISGIVVMYRVKSLHFRSPHAILGITSASLMIFLALTGYPVFIASKLRSYVRPVLIKCGHNFLGIACFAIGIAAQCTGYRYFRVLNSEDFDWQLVCIIVSVLITILSVRSALPALFRQFISLFK
ncbi:transmembrane reductase CYB561D2 [Xylocopa sonorina]|uniref:transmembrane reductase CYB561D2 n=1 Tax=Xylocopa sonorina TaxID=1818115 RepID=UPI00403AB82C